MRTAICIAMLVAILLSEWLWWESYRCTVNWSKRHELFPLPFYIVYLPHWLVVDMSIAIIALCASVLTYMALTPMSGGRRCGDVQREGDGTTVDTA